MVKESPVEVEEGFQVEGGGGGVLGFLIIEVILRLTLSLLI
jgi:hypothetical protein